MPKFQVKRPVPYTPSQMFEVVSTIEDYPQFLPLCEGLDVTSRTTDDEGRDILVATMSVGYKSISEHFTTRVTVNRETQRILVEYLDGPFRYLQNTWCFLPHDPGGCVIDFYIDYEFRSPMLGLLVGSMFDKAFRKFAEAFEARAGVRFAGHPPQVSQIL